MNADGSYRRYAGHPRHGVFELDSGRRRRLDRATFAQVIAPFEQTIDRENDLFARSDRADVCR